jgi:hypothetical protein
MKDDETKKYSSPLILDLGAISEVTFGATKGPGDETS